MLKKTVQFVALIVISTLLMSSCDAYKTDSSENNSSAVTTESVIEKADCSFEELFVCLFDAMETGITYEDYVREGHEELRQQIYELNNDVNRSRGIINIREFLQTLGDDYCCYVLIEYDILSEEYQNMYVGDEITIYAVGDFTDANTGEHQNSLDIEWIVTAIYGQYVLCLSDGEGYSQATYPPFLTAAGRSVYDTFIKIKNGEYVSDQIPVPETPVVDNGVQQPVIASMEPEYEAYDVDIIRGSEAYEYPAE